MPVSAKPRVALVRLAAVFVFLLAVLRFARPTPVLLAGGACLMLCGEWIRVWSAGHLVKTEVLVTSGPYRRVRNPLYLGRLLIFSGLCIAASLPHGLSWILLPGGWAVFFGYYLPRKERVEPARLREIHGEAYERYRAAVPPLLPRRTAWPEASSARWSASLALRNREHWMVVGLTAILAFLSWRI
jgi:protein-S-isoprenylcysteine O-methyltransferase Ste14